MAFRGIKVIELVGLAPVPFCGMILADQGARVIRVSNPQPSFLQDTTFVRGKETISLNLKDELHKTVFRRLCSTSDVLLDPNRAGVLERLSLAPDSLLSENPALIVARITGYGHTESPMQLSAGHDINYLATSGVLSTLRKSSEVPNPPINYLADFAGGGLMCAFGIAAALFERTRSGRGQIVDCSMTEGASYVSSFRWLSQNLPFWGAEPGTGLLDGAAHYYRCYRTKDAKFMAVGAIEPKFYNALIAGLGLSSEEAPQMGSDSQALHAKFEAIFNTKTQKEWEAVFEGSDACVTPVLEWDEAGRSPLARVRNAFLDDGSPAPAPRLSAHPGLRPQTKAIESNPIEILKECGCSEAEIAAVLKTSSKL